MVKNRNSTSELLFSCRRIASREITSGVRLRSPLFKIGLVVSSLTAALTHHNTPGRLVLPAGRFLDNPESTLTIIYTSWLSVKSNYHWLTTFRVIIKCHLAVLS